MPDNLKPGEIRCNGCAWFAPVESMHEAEKWHNLLQKCFGDILPAREGEVGICRKVTFSADKPVLTHESGFCHRADEKE